MGQKEGSTENFEKTIKRAKKVFVVANWKMNPKSLKEAMALFNSLLSFLKENPKIFKNLKIVVCPPILYLPYLFGRSIPKIEFGAQNCFWAEKGPYTGEISPRMIKDFGAKYVIVGHSERRNILGETDEMINKKLKAVLKEKLRPILCVGEAEKEKRAGKTKQVLEHQLKCALKSILNLKSKIPNFLVAYEPVWAIGTGRPCQPKEAREILLFLRKILKKIPILYGGSVNSKNAKDYIEVGFDGLLIGSASLKIKEFLKIIEKLSK